jgi:hypothetical protein
MKGTAFIIPEGKRKVTALNFPRLWALVILVRTGCKQGRALGSEDGTVMGSGLLECVGGERSSACGLNCVFGGLQYDEILIMYGGLFWTGILKLMLGGVHEKHTMHRGF